MQERTSDRRLQPRRRRILFATTAIDRSGAGLFEAVCGLASRLAKAPNTTVTLLSSTPRRLTTAETEAWRGVEIVAEVTRSRASAAVSMYRLLSAYKADAFDIVHAHGIWDGASVAASNWAMLNDKPFVLSPHGMLEPWALRHHWAKKALPWVAWERATIQSATVVEAKSRLEANNIWLLGFRNPLAVIPIAVEDRAAPRPHTSPDPIRTCLYVSRIHPKKGVELLIDAWQALKPSGWRLLIAGPDGGAYQRSLERMVETYGIARDVKFIGPVYGNDKWNLFQNAALFCLPSYSENFGIVVAEALSQSIPVVTTTATPWDELAVRNCGWQVSPTCAGIQTALAEAFQMPRENLRRMGEKGCKYVHKCFQWDVITRDTLDLYAWACDGGPPPQSLREWFDSQEAAG